MSVQGPGSMKGTPPLSSCAALFTILKAVIGGGVLVLPYAFSKVRLMIALPALLFVALLVALGTYRLIQCKILLCRGIAGSPELESAGSPDSPDGGVGPLGAISLRVLGRPGLFACTLAALATQFGAGVAYTDVIIETLARQVGIGKPWLRTALCSMFCLLSVIRGLKSLAWLSAVGLAVYAYIAFALIKFGICAVKAGAIMPLGTSFLPPRWAGIGSFLGTAIGAFEGIVVVQYVFEEMQLDNVAPFRAVLRDSYLVTIVIYSLLGGFGYVVYGDRLNVVVYENFPQDSVDVLICEVVLCIVLVISFMLQMYPVFHFLEEAAKAWAVNRKLLDDRDETTSSETTGDSKSESEDEGVTGSTPLVAIALRWSVVVLSALAAVAVPNVETMINYVGAFGLSFLGLILPGMIHIKLSHSQLSGMELLSDMLLILFGLTAMVLAVVS